MKRKNFTPYAIGLASGLVPLGFLPVLIENLTPQDFAVVALFATFTSLMSVFDLGASQFVLKTEHDKALDALMTKFILMQSVVTFSGFFLSVHVFSLTPLTITELSVVLFASSVKFASTPFKNILIKSGKIVEVNSLHLGSSLIRYLPAFFYQTRSDLSFYLWSFSVAAIVELVGAHLFSRTNLALTSPINFGFLKKKILECRYISLNAIFSAASQYADRFFVLNIFSISIASSYLAIVSAGAAIFLVLNPFTNIFVHSVFGRNRNSRSDNCQIMIALLALQIAVSAVIFVGGFQLLGIINLSPNTELLIVLNLVLIGNILHYMLGLQYFILLSENKEGFFLKVNVCGAFLSISIYMLSSGSLVILAAVWPAVNFLKLALILAWKGEMRNLILAAVGCIIPTLFITYMAGGFFGTTG